MTTISAKAHFLKTQTESTLTEIAGAVNSNPVKSAMVVVLSQMAEERETQEALRGAVRFRALLMNVTEKETAAPDFKPQELERVPGTPDGR